MPVPENLREKLSGKKQQRKKPDADSSNKPADLAEIISDFNRRHAVLMLGGKCVILNHVHDPVFNRPDITLSSIPDFKHFYAPEKVLLPSGNNGQLRPVPKAAVWFESEGRRQYNGIGFFPQREVSGYFNLWRGFGVNPQPGNWGLYHEFLHEVVCKGEEANSLYLYNWLADLVQNPGGERSGVSVVLRGKQGTGKGTFVREIGALLGSHFLQVSSPHHFTGRFNQHLKDCLLLFVDEGMWAGDRAAEGVLKALITEDTILIEPKGKDSFAVKNYCRFIIASNNAWVIPAGLEERRFFMLDVDEAVMQDHAYFARLRDQMAKGGREAMLYDLLRVDLAGVDLRQPPQTDALFEQKLFSADSVTKWWFSRLQNGAQLKTSKEWLNHIPTASLHDDYLRFARDLGFKIMMEDALFSRKLRKLCPGVHGPRRLTIPDTEAAGYATKRVYCLTFPDLDNCRRHFETHIRMQIQWPIDVECLG